MAENVIGEAAILLRPLTKLFASQVEKEAGAAVKKATGEIEKKANVSFQKVLATAGVAVTGLGALLTKHGRDLQRSQIGLTQVIENAGGSWSQYEKQVDAATKTQARYGHGAADVREALTKLSLVTKSPDVALKSLSVTADLAAIKNISLADAAVLVGRAYQGNAKLLKQFGIDGINAAKATENLKDATAAHSKAVDRLNRAQGNLRDLEASIAEGRKKTNSDLRRERDARQSLERTQKRGSESVAEAQEHLVDVQDELATQTETSLSDQIRLREATQDVLQAQQRAAEDLADANQNLLDIDAEFAERQKLSVSEAQSLRDARLEVSQAQAESARTATDLAVAQKASSDAAAAGAANLALLQEKIGGIAEEQADTLIGKLDGIKTSLFNVAAELGEKTGPAVLGLGTLLTGAGGLGSAISGVDSLISLKLIPKLGAAAAAFLGPVGLSAAVIGFSAIMVKSFQEAGEAVDQFVHDHLPGLERFLLDHIAPALTGVKEKIDGLFGLDSKKVGVLTPYLRDIFKPTPTKHSGGSIPSFATGGEVPILAQSGEFVMRRSAVNRVGLAGMNAINSGRGGAQTIIVPVVLDGREIARVTANPMRDEMIRQNRGNVDVFGGRA